MARQAIVALDQGTTNTKAVLFSLEGQILAERARSVPVCHPQPGWAEQSAERIWETVQEVLADIVADNNGCEILALGITNQRETFVLWERSTGIPVAPAILWQCRRSSRLCDDLRSEGTQSLIVERTGLVLDPLFPSTKIRWLLDQDESLRARALRGELIGGTIDSWLIWNLTGGAVHATDHSNASRTQLFDIERLAWDQDLLSLFGVPASLLPKVMDSDSLFGHVASGVTVLGGGVPICGVLGDSHAALYGHGIRSPGSAKVTCGTGSSIMTLTSRRIRSNGRLSSTIAWSRGGEVAYGLEGNISVSGHAAQFATRLLGLPDERALTEFAQSVKDSDGVSFVPALAGLGAPHWDDRARGLISGMSLRTNSAHVARAVFEAIAHQICDVCDAMGDELGDGLDGLSVDGGASKNDFLMQLLADFLGEPVKRPSMTEVSALGAARMAGEALGVWRPARQGGLSEFLPQVSPATRRRHRQGWAGALARARLPAPSTIDHDDNRHIDQGVEPSRFPNEASL